MQSILCVCRVLMEEHWNATSNHAIKGQAACGNITPRLKTKLGSHEDIHDGFWIMVAALELVTIDQATGH